MNSNNKLKPGALDKALDLLNSKRKNYNQKIHDNVRDYIMNNLWIIDNGLVPLEKELRVMGGSVDIVAKDDKFYLIEVKTRLSRNSSRSTGVEAGQLLRQKAGIRHSISLLTGQKPAIKLILAEYIRDTRRMIINVVEGSGKMKLIKEISLKGI